MLEELLELSGNVGFRTIYTGVFLKLVPLLRTISYSKTFV